MPNRLIRLPEVMQLIGLKKSTIYKLMKSGDFPKQISLSGRRSVGWSQNHIEKWMNERIDD